MPQETLTKLTLVEFARLMGIVPLHFWGVTIDDLSRTAGQGPVCGEAWLQYPWQDVGRPSREIVAQAIAEAESEIEALLGYHLLPAWDSDEWAETARPLRKELFNLNGRDLRGFPQGVSTRWGNVITGGARAAEALDDSAGVTYANDGRLPTSYENIATVSVTVSAAVAAVLQMDEVAVYYPGHGGDDRWRIRPVTASISGDTVTITFPREQAVVEDVLTSYDIANLRAIDGGDDASFLDEVEVWRVYNNPAQQVDLLWEPLGGCACGGSSCQRCSWSTQTGCLIARGDPRLGQFGYNVGTWDEETQGFTAAHRIVARNPDLVRLWYRSGLRDQSLPYPNSQMTPEWARIVTYYAVSKLDKPPCGCSTQFWEHWNADLAFSGGGTELSSFNLTQSDLGNPLGTTRGAINAWRRIKRPGAVIGRVALDT